MRHYEITLYPREGKFHEFESYFVSNDTAHRKAIHQIKAIGEDVGVLLYEFGGDLDTVRDILDEEFEDVGYQTTEYDNSLFLHTTFSLNNTLRTLLEIPENAPFVIDFPMTFDDHGNLHITVIGDGEMIRQGLEFLPDSIDATVDKSARYLPEDDRIESDLTSRQQETVVTAIRMGYYDTPRKTTYKEIGDALDITPQTVGDHLRKAESLTINRVFDIEEQSN